MPVEDGDCEAVILAVEEAEDDMENYVAVEDEEILSAGYEIFKEHYADQLDFED